jgi:nucleotide-binding universal stress UspA family protein
MADNERPVVIAYDGSDYAKEAIKQAGEQLREGRRAIVLTVYEPLGSLGFVGTAAVVPEGLEEDVEGKARAVAEEGAELARRAGFDAGAAVQRGDPIWQRIVEFAEEHDAGIVVMGSHGRTGISQLLLGSVAGATASHTARPILIAHLGSQPTPDGDT